MNDQYRRNEIVSQLKNILTNHWAASLRLTPEQVAAVLEHEKEIADELDGYFLMWHHKVLLEEEDLIVHSSTVEKEDDDYDDEDRN